MKRNLIFFSLALGLMSFKAYTMEVIGLPRKQTMLLQVNLANKIAQAPNLTRAINNIIAAINASKNNALFLSVPNNISKLINQIAEKFKVDPVYTAALIGNKGAIDWIKQMIDEDFFAHRDIFKFLSSEPSVFADTVLFQFGKDIKMDKNQRWFKAFDRILTNLGKAGVNFRLLITLYPNWLDLNKTPSFLREYLEKKYNVQLI